MRSLNVIGSAMKSRKMRRENEKKSQAKSSIIAFSSFQQEKNAITLVFGWYIHIQGARVEQLDLELLTDANLLARYTYWCIKERGRSHHTGVQAALVGIAIAKWKNINKSKRRNWSDIEVIQELRNFKNHCNEQYQEKKKKFEDEKWKDKELTHPEARQVVQYLRSCCATHGGKVSQSTGKRIKGKARHLSAVVWSLQVYLIVKTFVYMPVRQQEVRQYELGKTLFRKLDAKGRPYYQVIITEHKNKSKTGKDRNYKLPRPTRQKYPTSLAPFGKAFKLPLKRLGKGTIVVGNKVKNFLFEVLG